VLKASAQLLQRRAARGLPIDAEEARARLSVIEANASRLARRLDDLSDLSLLEAGLGIDLNLGLVDLVEVAKVCIDAARRVTMAHNLRLEVDQAEIVGSFDADRIERVLDNLISNAIKYSPDGGDVVVRLWSDPVNAFVSVADQGIGVPVDDRDAVFQFRKRGSNVGSTPGSGVGLAGAARLVELAGGEITIEQRDGPGSTFVVCLPLSPPREGR
jgi:signal transduction histidine kinase